MKSRIINFCLNAEDLENGPSENVQPIFEDILVTEENLSFNLEAANLHGQTEYWFKHEKVKGEIFGMVTFNPSCELYDVYDAIFNDLVFVGQVLP